MCVVMSEDDDNPSNPRCACCGGHYSNLRMAAGYRTCLSCGEKHARQVKHTIVPMPKSNYIVVTDHSLLKGLNSSHKGNK